MSQALLAGGLILCGLSVVGTIAAIVFGVTASKRLRVRLDEEYGEKPR